MAGVAAACVGHGVAVMAGRMGQDPADPSVGWEELPADPKQWAIGPDESGTKTSAADGIIHLAVDAMTCFHDGETAYAEIHVDGHRETHQVRSNWMRRWLRRVCYQNTHKSARAGVVSEVIETLDAIATDPKAPEWKTHRRVATVGDRLYIDLADDTWTCIEVDTTGWRVVADGPHFIRPLSMKPLPRPEPVQATPRDGLLLLRRLLNISGEDFVLVVGWLLAALRDAAPYPILVLLGEHGTAKTVATEIIRSLVDPSEIATRAPSRTERDLFVATGHTHVLCFDNVSTLPFWLSDGLCRVSTGSAYPSRQLRTDGDEWFICATRPIILNGITARPVRGDLADRAITVRLEPIPEDRRRKRGEIDLTFQSDAPKILAALLDGLVEGLRNASGTRLARLPRMADFAIWVTACETVYWSAGEFMRVYDAARNTASQTVIESSTVARVLLALMNGTAQWTGTMSDLRAALEQQASDLDRRSTDWPGFVETLARQVDRLTPDLEAIGVDVIRTRTGHRRTVRLAWREGPPP